MRSITNLARKLNGGAKNRHIQPKQAKRPLRRASMASSAPVAAMVSSRASTVAQEGRSAGLCAQHAAMSAASGAGKWRGMPGR